MAKDKKGKKNRALPAILMAGAIVVPNAASARELARDLRVTADSASVQPLVADSQAAWGDGSVESIHQAQWGQVTWGQVVWARGARHDNP